MIYAASVEYSGEHFHGWQSQQSARSVQSELEKALSFVANEAITVQCAGRTDAGVHALNQVISFHSHARREQRSWLLGVNSRLPDDISLNWLVPVKKDFHARFSAYGRYYRYIIFQSGHPGALFSKRYLWERTLLDVDKMNLAARYLIGEHDFSAFRSAQCQAKHAFRYIERVEVSRCENLVYIDVVGNAFLQNMVRIITGMLLEVGKGRQEPEWAAFLLDSKDRTLGAKTAPAHGLYFVHPFYPDHFDLPAFHHYPGFPLITDTQLPTSGIICS